MEPHAPLFPSFAAPLSDLYGASSFRAAEAQASALDLDELDREELALERTVRALVDRQAPPPIGLKFHRGATAHVNASVVHSASYLNSSSGSVVAVNSSGSQRLQRGGVAPVGTEGSRLGSGVQTTRGYHGAVAEDDEEEEEDEMEEDEDDLEELEEEEEEEEELFAGEEEEDDDDDDDDAARGRDDHDDDAASDSMDMST